MGVSGAFASRLPTHPTFRVITLLRLAYSTPRGAVLVRLHLSVSPLKVSLSFLLFVILAIIAIIVITHPIRLRRRMRRTAVFDSDSHAFVARCHEPD